MSLKTTTQKLNKLKETLDSYESVSSLDRGRIAVLIGEQVNKALNVQQLGAIQQTLWLLDNSTPTKEIILELARRVIENKQFILEGYPIPTWDGSEISTTVGICKAEHGTENNKNLGIRLICRGLTGLVAGQLFPYDTEWSFAYTMLERDLGLRKVQYLLHPLYLSGLVFNVSMLRTDKGYIKWTKIWATQAQKDRNKELLQARYERKGCNDKRRGPCYKCQRNRSACFCAVK